MCKLCSDPNHTPDRALGPRPVSRRQVFKVGVGLAAAPLLMGAFPTRLFASDARVKSKGYAVFASDGKFKPYEFTRHPVGDNDVLIDILYAGI